MQRIYLDANVFIAFIKSELGKGFKLMEQDVEEFFRQARKKYLLILSDWFFDEVKRNGYYSKEDVLGFFSKRRILFEVINTTKEDLVKAKNEFGKIHKTDAVHAVLALKSKCSVLLTFNTKDFEPIKNLIEVCEPSELIP